MKKSLKLISALILIIVMLTGCQAVNDTPITATSTTKAVTQKAESTTTTTTQTTETEFYEVNNVPDFSGKPYIIINNNIPDFKKSDYTTTSYEKYGELDYLGRCTMCIACIGTDIMPTEERQSIGSIKPTGWHTIKYNNVDGKYLYNRCHLIGYQLTAENANAYNLITGTRFLNVEGMLPFEDEVAQYVRQTNNHVLYRVTPIFKGEELIARGVQMEAYSVEDNGKGVQFNVYCYNNQPDIIIDYKTGESKSEYNYEEDNSSKKDTYIVNTSTKKFHKPSCRYAKEIKEENKKTYFGLKDSLINNGFEPCGSCKP